LLLHRTAASLVAAQNNPEQSLAAVAATPKVVRLGLVGLHSWTVPADWNDANNKIEVIGGGGAGSSGQNSAGGGGGGAYARVNNLNLTPGSSVLYSVGKGGLIGFWKGEDGGDTWFNSKLGSKTFCSGELSVCAKGGQGGVNHDGGLGGAAASSVGAVRYDGGKGASRQDGGCDGCTGGNDDGNGGGGAAGPYGAGMAGGAYGPGGRGDANKGGAGGLHGCSSGYAGTEWVTVGAGGGGGGGPDDGPGCEGGLYGGGGGGKGDDGWGGGAGRQGLIVITYTPSLKAANPTVSITAGGAAGTANAFVGNPITIRATFAAASGDALTGTAISGPAPYKYAFVPGNYNWVAAPGITLAPNTPEVFTFTPQAPGDYTFIPDVKTTDHPAWDDYGKFVTVHVTCNGVCAPPTCPANQHVQNGICVANANSCPPGQILIGGGCVVANSDQCANMPGLQSVVPANCVQQPLPGGSFDCVPVNDSYVVVGAQCKQRGVISSFLATPARLRRGDTAQLDWSVSGMTSCGVRTSDGLVIVPQTASNGSDGIHHATAVVNQATIYRLNCTDGTSSFTQEKLVTVVPDYEEI
jgi:hypothetical protein